MINRAGLCLEEQQRWDADPQRFVRIYDFPLTPTSKVLDVGGHDGEWTAGLIRHHGFTPNVRMFEPVVRFANRASERFKDNPNVRVHQWGLSNFPTRNETFTLDHECTGVRSKGHEHIVVQLRDIREENIADTDLMSVNIEGGEYALLYRMLETRQIEQVKFLQVQFHNLALENIGQRHEIRANLRRTHEEIYKFSFVWEAWRRK